MPEIEAETTELPESNHCVWRSSTVVPREVLEIWNTSCGQAFSFTDGGVEDNGFVFCYKCGKRIDPGKYSDSVSVEGKSE